MTHDHTEAIEAVKSFSWWNYGLDEVSETQSDDWAHALVAEIAPLIVAAERERWRAVLDDLTDPDPCWFDHHGGCQAHGFISLQPGEKCPNAQAKDLLAEAAAARTVHPVAASQDEEQQP